MKISDNGSIKIKYMEKAETWGSGFELSFQKWSAKI